MPWIEGDGLTPTNLNTRMGAFAYSVTDPAYGAVGDGVTNNTAAIQAAVNDAVAIGGADVIIPPSALGYVVNDPVVINGDNVTLRIHGTLLRTTAPGAEGMVEIKGSLTATTTTLSSAATRGDTLLSVASSSGFAANDWIEIESAATIGGQQVYIDIQQVKSVAAGSIVLAGALRQDMNTAGPTVVTVTKLTMISNSHIIGPAELVHSVSTDAGYLARCLYGVGCSIRDLTGNGHRSTAFLFQRSVGCVASGLRPEDTDDPSGDGYGVQFESTHDSAILNSHGRNNRHSFDLARGSTGNVLYACSSRDDASDGIVLGHGQVGRGNRAVDCTVYGAVATGFILGNNSYGSDFETTLMHCRAIGCASYGFVVKQACDGIRLIDCEAIDNGAQGFRIEGTTGKVTLDCPYGVGNASSQINVVTGVVGPVTINNPNVHQVTTGVVVEIVAADTAVLGGTVTSDGTANTGVRANGVDGVRVEGVYFDNFANRAVQGSGIDGLTVMGCTVRNTPLGVLTDNTSNYAIVVGNNLRGIATPTTLDGANNEVANNIV